ncbi:phosphatase PAP2 family protein [Hoeflea poritis]|uniref:Phosphatase PAP2 family protein n=1 Tax=Hoeflea poritis TaxID=2993659 RepID=A0ABT4VQ10_9HYPH|nr:phosphatase PAP2 family protein [Hoeflea poritis]MDA4846793.1 phosphatase PAP2 family protein [Hoeflea poritis]
MTHVNNDPGQPTPSSGNKYNIISYLKVEYRRNTLFYLILFVLLLYTTIKCIISGETLTPFVTKYTIRAVRFILLCASITSIVWLLAFFRHDCSLAEYTRRTWKHVSAYAFNARIRKALLGVIIFTAIMAPFLYWKMKIPHLNPFSWDQTFAIWDSQLFFGRQAWEILLPVFENHPALTRAIDGMYLFWMFVCYAFFCGLLLSDSRRVQNLRSQYWLATILSWIIIGLVAATALSSAGPIYFEAVTGDGQTYGPLVEYLRSFGSQQGSGSSGNLQAINTANHLWDVYTGAVNAPAGISAMPSMHNAQALLFCLAAFRIRLWFGLLMTLYAAIILVGSVHLAWHYFVDGIVAYAMVLPIWHFSGWVLNRKQNAVPVLKDHARTNTH